MATIEPYVARGRQPLDLNHRLPANDPLVVEQTLHAGKEATGRWHVPSHGGNVFSVFSRRITHLLGVAEIGARMSPCSSILAAVGC